MESSSDENDDYICNLADAVEEGKILVDDFNETPRVNNEEQLKEREKQFKIINTAQRFV